MPTVPDRNHVRQVSQNGAADCSVVIVAAPPTAETDTAITTAVKKPPTRRKSQKVKGRPNHRWSSQANRTASPALQRPLRTDVGGLLSLMRLAATVPTRTPTTSATPPDDPDNNNRVCNPRRRPKHGHVKALCEQGESELGSEEIG